MKLFEVVGPDPVPDNDELWTIGWKAIEDGKEESEFIVIDHRPTGEQLARLHEVMLIMAKRRMGWDEAV